MGEVKFCDHQGGGGGGVEGARHVYRGALPMLSRSSWLLSGIFSEFGCVQTSDH